MLKRSIAIIFLLPFILHAAEDAESEQSVWQGEGELGFTSTSGNTDAENLNASLGLSRQEGKWKHAASIDSIRNKSDDEVSAESTVFKEKSEYQWSENSYVFGQLRYEDDEFGAYRRQTTIAFGAGSRFLQNERHLLDMSLGLGYRSLREGETREELEDSILTANLDYEFKISETATFSEAILVESGDENTHAESDTSLKAKIDGNLATKISYLVKHNSDVPAGTDKTDEIVTVSLVYAF